MFDYDGDGHYIEKSFFHKRVYILRTWRSLSSFWFYRLFPPYIIRVLGFIDMRQWFSLDMGGLPFSSIDCHWFC